MVRTGASRRRPVHGRARHRDRERRSTLDPGRSRVLAGQPAVGDLRVRARLRRLSAARRTDGRPPWPSPHLHGRPGHVRDRLSPLRARLVRGIADRRPRPSGPRRRDDLAGRARDPDDHLRRRSGAEHRARRLGRCRRLRRRRGRAPRRRPHGRAVVGVDLLRQHPRRARGPRPRSCAARREQGHADQDVRCARRDPRHLRPHHARARDHAGSRLGLELRPHDRRLRPLGRVCSSASSPGRTASPSR